MKPRSVLFVPSKKSYVRGKRPAVECILCAALAGDARVKKLLVATDREVFVTMNLYPYNPGHVMVVPRRHLTDPRECTPRELAAISRWTNRMLDALDKCCSPQGYNVGYNIGTGSGASIDHMHLHIVPRYRNEVGYIDVLGGARVHVEDPARMIVRLRRLIRTRAK